MFVGSINVVVVFLFISELHY